MDTFPLEIIDLIVFFADHETRDQLLTVSRRFQCSVEKYNWSGYCCATRSMMKKFLEMYRGYRSRYLRYISVRVEFPYLVDTEKMPIKCRETTDEIQANNERLTRQIMGLFKALKALEEREGPHNRPAGIRLHIENPYQRDNNHKHCYHHRYRGWRLSLLNPEDLPTLSCVQELTINKSSELVGSGYSEESMRPLDLGLVSALISKLPNLKVLNCLYLSERFPEAYEDEVVSHFTRPWEGPWRDTRHAFGNTMLSAPTLPHKIEKAKLLFGHGPRSELMVDQARALPDLVDPFTYDPVSTALRVFSQRVVELKIRACADSTIFWPSPDDAKSESPSWPYLRHLRVEFRPVSPSGVWYFQGSRGEGRNTTGFKVTQEHYPPVEENADDERWDDVWAWEGGRFENRCPNMFRIVPNDEVIEPLLEAFAKAMEKMPLLETAELFTMLTFFPGGDTEQEYSDDEIDKRYLWGLRYHFPKDNKSGPLLEWRVGDWRPSKKLLQRFHDLGSHRAGEPFQEKWLDWQYLDWSDPWRDLTHS
ncbi:hypothetical protein DIZ76_015346 [Coccidioides immitis]|nr:hypothetical protein DIZ76_015346 [Coccidioides immitis]